MGTHLTRFKRHVQKLNERYAIDILREMQTKRCPMFWILGGPCSGKTMMCSRAARFYNFHHINVDHLLRKNLSRSHKLCDQLYAANGNLLLLPREYIIGLIQEEVQKNCFACRGFLLEGYPRSVGQAAELVKEVGPPSVIFYLQASFHLMHERLQRDSLILQEVGLEEKANDIKIYSFYKFYYPLLLQYRARTVRINTDGDVEATFLRLMSIFQRILKQKKMRIPRRLSVT